MDFFVLADHAANLKENEKKDKYLELARELKKTVEHESDSENNYNWYFSYSHQRTGRLGYKKSSGDHTNYNNTKIDKNTEKSPGDLKGLGVIQTQVKNHRLTLMWKNRKGVK